MANDAHGFSNTYFVWAIRPESRQSPVTFWSSIVRADSKSGAVQRLKEDDGVWDFAKEDDVLFLSGGNKENAPLQIWLRYIDG